MKYYMYYNCFNFNICCIRVKFELLNYGWIVGYIYIVMNIGLWAQVTVLIRLLYWTVWDRLYAGFVFG